MGKMSLPKLILNYMINPSPIDKIKRQLERKGLTLVPKLPERILFCGAILDEVLASFKVVERIDFMHEDNPFFVLDIDGKKLTIAKLVIGPVAIQLAEEAHTLGAKDFFVYGKCGALLKNISSDQFFLIENALAGDSCSLYYLGKNDPGRLIKPAKTLGEDLADFLKKKNIYFVKTTTWTTFGFYIQTDEVRNKAIEAGATCVDGEMAAMFAFANYHKVSCSALLFWSDKTAPGEPYLYRTIEKGKPEFELIKKLGLELCRWLAK